VVLQPRTSNVEVTAGQRTAVDGSIAVVCPGRTARNHLLWLAASNAVATQRVDVVLDMVGLGGVGHCRAGNFCLGMGQRLGIAAVLLGDPEVLIFDEPINGLDPEKILWLRDLLRSLATEGRTVLVLAICCPNGIDRAHLDERAWRLLLGAEAKVLGRGGIKVVAAAVGAHPDTVAQGVRELDYPDWIPGRVRRLAAGRPAAAVSDPTLWEALDALVDPVTRGDPMSSLRSSLPASRRRHRPELHAARGTDGRTGRDPRALVE